MISSNEMRLQGSFRSSYKKLFKSYCTFEIQFNSILIGELKTLIFCFDMTWTAVVVEGMSKKFFDMGGNFLDA